MRILLRVLTPVLVVAACGGNGTAATTTQPAVTTTAATIVATTSTVASTTTTQYPYPYDFSIHPDAPVIRPGDWDSGYTAVPWVIVEDDSWSLFYSGAKARVSSLGLATSSDGVSWVKNPANPLFTPPGAGLGWFFVFETGAGWEMLYVTGFTPPYRVVNRATSPAMEGPWEDQGEAFRASDQGWDEFIVPTGVTRIGDSLYMPYAGYGQLERVPAIGILVSADGVTWEPMTTGPIYTATEGTWDEMGVVPMNLVETERGWELFFMGFNEPPRVGFQADVIPFGRLITTDDGATWAVDNEGLPIGDTGERGWPGVTVVYEGGTYWLFLGDDLGSRGISLVTGTIP